MLSSLIKNRPAETAGATLGIAGVVTAIATGDAVVAITAASNFVPAVVTFVVEHGGLRGLFLTLWRGRS